MSKAPTAAGKADTPGPVIDGLQYCNWSRAVFEEMSAGGVVAAHVTVSYHENFRETVDRIVEWNWRFVDHADLIMKGTTAADIDTARSTGRTAIFFGLQNPLPIETDLGLVEVLATLGLRFMQLSYNNQSLLCAGWQEPNDSGLTRFGREVIAEMNRVGMVPDMSHSGERSTLETIEASQRPVAVTHANPSSWHPTGRNKSDRVLDALAASGGMLGLSLYPHHLKGGSACPLDDFTAMVARLADRIGVGHIGFGSDLCQGQPDSVVAWMRTGKWTRADANIGFGKAVFPAQPSWFRDNRDYPGIRTALRARGFSAADADAIMYGNWRRFFETSFTPAAKAA